MITKCCSKEFKNNECPIYWNPFNKVIQCHACGEQYEDVITAATKAGGRLVESLVKNEKLKATYEAMLESKDKDLREALREVGKLEERLRFAK